MAPLKPSNLPPDTVLLSPVMGDFTLPQVLSVEDALEWEGGWILLDPRLGRIHFLRSSSGLVRSIGSEGPGPGEFHAPAAMARQDSILWVLNQRGTVLDRYSLPSQFLARRTLHGGGCLVGLVKRMVPLGEGAFVLLRTCPSTLPGPGSAWVERVFADGTLTPLASLPLGDPGSRRLHFARQPALAGEGTSLFLGTWDTPCLHQLDREGRSLGVRCLPSYSRPLTPQAERSELQSRFGRITALGFLPLEIPEHLPWYDRGFSIPQGLVVRRLRGPEERDLVLLRSNGSSSVLAALLPEATFVGETTILVADDLMQGTRIRIYPNPWP